MVLWSMTYSAEYNEHSGTKYQVAGRDVTIMQMIVNECTKRCNSRKDKSQQHRSNLCRTHKEFDSSMVDYIRLFTSLSDLF